MPVADRADCSAPVVRRRLEVAGIVQGVGFRPFVYNLATHLGLAGWVYNCGHGVVAEVEGPASAVAAFERDLAERPPALATVTGVVGRDVPLQGETGFRILASHRGEVRRTTVPADAATCAACRSDLLDPKNRRYHYPFTNCTNCGPRFTIIRDIPYDRPYTTMAGFPMCPDCEREYHDPANRRFHAQPNACPTCGPKAQVVDPEGRRLAGEADWLDCAVELLGTGKIVAVKGLGGFHLACDACNAEAVDRLRSAKHREHRPFAVMARDIATVRQICRLTADEERLLKSPAAPILLLQRLPHPELPVAAGVAPNLDTIGVMLPYTPLHILLLETGLPLLVMTSGNPSGLPLCTEESQALRELHGLADAFLIHNRPIHVPCDDSVVQLVDGETAFIRRSRGYVPREITVPDLPAAESGAGPAPAVLGVGGDLKNTFCLLQGGRAVFSQHLGDMGYQEGQENYLRALDHLQRLTEIRPTIIGHDMHPGYHSAHLAQDLPAEMHVPVQHHHAHMASCMAENGLTEDVIGLILDGTGYGPDGCIWGFEVLAGGYEGYRRVAHLAYSPLPGSEGAIRRPLMAAAGMVWAHLGDEGLRRLAVLHPEAEPQLAMARTLLERNFNCPLAGTAGRLFDGVSALLGICLHQTYEGQAAVELGAVAPWEAGPAYPVCLRNGELDPAPLLEGLLADRAAGRTPAELAGRFLSTVLEMLVVGARQARAESGLSAVCLSGGTFHSAWLRHAATRRLADEGFRVYRHRHLPTGDGGLALGQAMIARKRWQRCV